MPPITYIPLHDRVLIQANRKADDTIVLPDGSMDALSTFTVLATGPDVKADLPVGTRVILAPRANILGLDDEKFIGLIHETNILCKLQ